MFIRIKEMRRDSEREEFAGELCRESGLWEILTDEQPGESVKRTAEMIQERGMEVELHG